ncbi:hypothetical protein ACFE04_004707 [Oxalis oulophora]
MTTISLATTIEACNGSKFRCQSSSTITTKRDSVSLVPPPSKQAGSRNFPSLLSSQGICHSDLRVHEIVQRQTQSNNSLLDAIRDGVDCCRIHPQFDPSFLQEAYDRSQKLCAEYAKTFYLGSLLMTEERQKAIWAIYVWCRRTDELVDGPNSDYLSSSVLDRWEERLEDIFNGRPYDVLDAALTDTVFKFPLDIKPFRDMIEGMRMDTVKCRYANFQELYLYCYYVAGTVGLMSVPVMGIAEESMVPPHTVYNSALYLGIGNQLTNILRDVGEDEAVGPTSLLDPADVCTYAT